MSKIFYAVSNARETNYIIYRKYFTTQSKTILSQGNISKDLKNILIQVIIALIITTIFSTQAHYYNHDKITRTIIFTVHSLINICDKKLIKILLIFLLRL